MVRLRRHGVRRSMGVDRSGEGSAERRRVLRLALFGSAVLTGRVFGPPRALSFAVLELCGARARQVKWFRSMTVKLKALFRGRPMEAPPGLRLTRVNARS